MQQTNWQFNESYQATVVRLAIGCYQALPTHGVSIPQQMRGAGYDDQKISEQMTPPLNSIQLPYGELGRLAVEYLCYAEDAATHLTLAGRLKVRRISGANL